MAISRRWIPIASMITKTAILMPLTSNMLVAAASEASFLHGLTWLFSEHHTIVPAARAWLAGKKRRCQGQEDTVRVW